jgi:hypothetical protein
VAERTDAEKLRSAEIALATMRERIWQNWDNEGRELPAASSGNGRAIS